MVDNTMDGATSAGLADQVKQQTQQAVDQAQDAASKVLDLAKTQFRSQLENQKNRVAGSVGSIASALRQAGQQLEGQNLGIVGQYAYSAANELDQLNGYIQRKRVDDLIVEAEDMARAHPEIFVGGAFALGLLAARFFKSSREALDGRNRALAPRDYNGADDVAPYLSARSVNEGSATYAG